MSCLSILSIRWFSDDILNTLFSNNDCFSLTRNHLKLNLHNQMKNYDQVVLKYKECQSDPPLQTQYI